jgi:hypothetical protein
MDHEIAHAHGGDWGAIRLDDGKSVVVDRDAQGGEGAGVDEPEACTVGRE